MARTVGDLRKALADPRLRDSDEVTGNQLGNLAIDRRGEYVGWIDLRNCGESPVNMLGEIEDA